MSPVETLTAPAQTVEMYFRAISALDTDGYLACFVPGAQVEDPVGTPVVAGHQALRTFIEGLTSLFKTLDIRPEAIHICGLEAAIPWRVVGWGHNGVKVTCEGVDCFRFDLAGRITELRAFWDPVPVIARLER